VTRPASGPASRRTFITLIGASAAAIAGGSALTACTGGNSGATSGRAESVNKLADLLPKYAAYEPVKPDLLGTNGAAPGFLKYPTQLRRAVPEKPVKSGKEVTAMTPLFDPQPPGLGHNSYFDANNERIGAPVRFNFVSGNEYATKLPPLLAAGNVPELLAIPGYNMQSLNRFGQAVDKLFEDLTPYLAGDKAAAYPMLANLPTESWAYCVWNSQLKAVPFPWYVVPMALFYRKDIFDQVGAEPPKSADELFALGKELTNAKANRWAFGSIDGEVLRAFGLPSGSSPVWGWHKNSDGRLVHLVEMPQFEEAVAFIRKVFQAGYVHPDVVGNNATEQPPLFEGGQIVMFLNGVGGWTASLQRVLPTNPKFDPQPVMPYAHDGGTPITWPGEPAYVSTFVRKGFGKDRVAELLGLLDYTAAPFGTEEYQLYTYGVEGKHYIRQSSGAPKLTPLGRKEVARTYSFLGGRPVAISQSEYPGYVESMTAWQNAAAKYRDKGPFWGIRIEQPNEMATLSQPMDDTLQDIYRGRKPMSALKAAVKRWQAAGINEARDFYAKVLRDNGR
jgi:putative aldouronate transport system substrate-binding protein